MSMKEPIPPFMYPRMGCRSVQFLKDYLSDSTPCSSTSGDLLSKRLPPKRTRRTIRNVPKTHPIYRVSRKQSLAQCLERQNLFRKKLTQYSDIAGLSPRLKHKYQAPIKEEIEFDWRGAGDHISKRHHVNETNIVYTAAGQCPESNVYQTLPEQHTFPFKNTRSGNFKLDPSQVIYESKHLSIVAADPASIKMNVTDSSKTVSTNPRPENENWDTKCLYTVGNGGDGVFGSDLSETVSESDGGVVFANGKSTIKTSELNLAKMGYVLDNCIEWKRFKLPKKSELQKLLLHNVLNKINPDIQIKIGNSVYNCHRLVWQCYSSFFTCHPGPQVELPENSVSKESFSLIYQWMLHLEPDSHRLLRRDNILDILKTATFLEIKELQNQCYAFIESMEVFCEDKAFLLYMEARKYNNREVMGMMVPRVQRFFLTLVSSKEFVEFSCEEVCTFLRSNFICIHCEMEVFMAGVRWLMHDWERRKSSAVEVMRCVRFGLIKPKTLVTMRRNPQSPEFLKITNISEVSKMIDDGVAFTILRSNFENKPDEEFKKNLKSFGLSQPEPRNWSGNKKDYQNYQEFLLDLAHYRSKQRLEIKRSKMQVQLEKVNDDDFLSSAVLPPATQQKIQHFNPGQNPRCIPHLNSKELTFLKKMISQEENTQYEKDNGKQQNPGCSKVNPHKPYKLIPKKRTSPIIKYISIEEQDAAARKIQTAYRTYSKKKLATHTDNATDTNATSNFQKIKTLFRSRSDPSIPSVLLKSSTNPSGTSEEVSLPLYLEKETVYIFGGSNPFSDYSESPQKIYQYVPKSNVWKKCGELPVPLYFHSAVYFQNKIYIAGGKIPSKNGQGGASISRQMWRYNPNKRNWSRMTDMIRPRHSFCFIAYQKNLYVIGGRDDFGRILASVEKFDTCSESWVEVCPMKVGRVGAAAAVFHGHIWVAGGLITEAIPTNTVECYNFQLDSWAHCSTLRYTMAFSSMVPVEDRLFVVGGIIGLQDNEPTGSGKHIDVWDPDSQTWCLASMMSKPRHAHAAVFVRNECYLPGEIFILGGMLSKHSCVTDHVECWRIDGDNRIMGVAPLPYPACGLAALALRPNFMD